MVVDLDAGSPVGHEQNGRRPAVVVSGDQFVNGQRFPVIAIVPLTSTMLQSVLYPLIRKGSHNYLKNDSYALTDQVRTIDKQRVCRLYGEVLAHELSRIDTGLRAFLSL